MRRSYARTQNRRSRHKAQTSDGARESGGAPALHLLCRVRSAKTYRARSSADAPADRLSRFRLVTPRPGRRLRGLRYAWKAAKSGSLASRPRPLPHSPVRRTDARCCGRASQACRRGWRATKSWRARPDRNRPVPAHPRAAFPASRRAAAASQIGPFRAPESFTIPPPNTSSATIFLTFATIAPVRGTCLEPGAGHVSARPIHARRPPMPTIALVDDDRNILTSVSIALESEGYRIMTYTDGASALERFKTSPPDLAILDIKMPRMDGMELLRRLRQKTDMPVIFLSSKDEEIDELFGLKMGADDFIRKPFSQRLLVERVKAVLRRVAPKDQTAPRETDAKALERGQLKMDPERHTCTWNGEPVTLTVTEFLILQALAQRPGVVKSRNALMDAAYDDQVYVDDRTIDSHIKRLRKKFKQADDDFEMIETLYGVGYRFKEA